jgi:hypothetical protein
VWEAAETSKAVAELSLTKFRSNEWNETAGAEVMPDFFKEDFCGV